MRIALTHNLRLTDSVDEAEFDSPETIDALAQSLASAGHDVERIEVSGPASRLVARLEAYAPDLIFNSAEGRRGKMRRGFYPALFQQLGMPSTGPDSYSLCVTLDKTLTKKIVAGYGVPTPRGRFITKETLRAGGLDDLIFPAELRGLVERHHAKFGHRRAGRARARHRRDAPDLPRGLAGRAVHRGNRRRGVLPRGTATARTDHDAGRVRRRPGVSARPHHL